MVKKIVDLQSTVTTEQIARFNTKFIPESRLSDQEFLHWRYRTLNSDGAQISTHYGILDRAEIAAQISTQPMRAWINGKWQPCNYWGDWFVNPNHKGAGLSLLNHVISHTSSLLACAGSKQAYNIYRSKKFTLMSIDQRFVLLARPFSAIIAARATPRNAGRLVQTWLKNPFWRIRSPSMDGQMQFAEAKSIDPYLLEGWENDIPGGAIFVRREPWMFSWFLDKFFIPEFKLITLMSGNAGTSSWKQEGYVLLHQRKQDNGLVEGKIVDLYARGWNKDHLDALFCHGVRTLIQQGVHIIRYHASHPLFTALAVDQGFTKTCDRRVIMRGPIAEAMGSGRTNLHITFYDHDEAYY